jgi:hypothetical protein
MQVFAPGPIARACRRVTVLGEREVTSAAVRIRLSSWPQQQEALAALRLLDYQVAEDSRDGEHGAALVVTGELPWKGGVHRWRVTAGRPTSVTGGI